MPAAAETHVSGSAKRGWGPWPPPGSGGGAPGLGAGKGDGAGRETRPVWLFWGWESGRGPWRNSSPRPSVEAISMSDTNGPAAPTNVSGLLAPRRTGRRKNASRPWGGAPPRRSVGRLHPRRPTGRAWDCQTVVSAPGERRERAIDCSRIPPLPTPSSPPSRPNDTPESSQPRPGHGQERRSLPSRSARHRSWRRERPGLPRLPRGGRPDTLIGAAGAALDHLGSVRSMPRHARAASGGFDRGVPGADADIEHPIARPKPDGPRQSPR